MVAVLTYVKKDFLDLPFSLFDIPGYTDRVLDRYLVIFNNSSEEKMSMLLRQNTDSSIMGSSFNEFKRQASFFLRDKIKTARLKLTDVTPAQLYVIYRLLPLIKLPPLFSSFLLFFFSHFCSFVLWSSVVYLMITSSSSCFFFLGSIIFFFMWMCGTDSSIIESSLSIFLPCYVMFLVPLLCILIEKKGHSNRLFLFFQLFSSGKRKT